MKMMLMIQSVDVVTEKKKGKELSMEKEPNKSTNNFGRLRVEQFVEAQTNNGIPTLVFFKNGNMSIQHPILFTIEFMSFNSK